MVSYFLFMAGSVFGIICAIFNYPFYLRLADSILVVVAIVYVLKNSYCPNCGKFGIRVTPFLKDERYCKFCGMRDERGSI